MTHPIALKSGTVLTLCALLAVSVPMSASPVAQPLVAQESGDAVARIDMLEFTFSDENGLPATVIAAGDSVLFVNAGAIPHTATDSVGPAWDTGNVNPGGAVTIAFPSSGVFVYECVYHAQMRGVLVVT